MDNLLPCPFCGGEAELVALRDGLGRICKAYAWCDKCETRGDFYNTEAEAIAAWNTRAERTCQMESVWGTNALQCSECCSYVSTWDAECEIGKINYCQSCGAKVIGGNNA